MYMDMSVCFMVMFMLLFLLFPAQLYICPLSDALTRKMKIFWIACQCVDVLIVVNVLFLWAFTWKYLPKRAIEQKTGAYFSLVVSLTMSSNVKDNGMDDSDQEFPPEWQNVREFVLLEKRSMDEHLFLRIKNTLPGIYYRHRRWFFSETSIQLKTTILLFFSNCQVWGHHSSSSSSSFILIWIPLKYSCFHVLFQFPGIQDELCAEMEIKLYKDVPAKSTSSFCY